MDIVGREADGVVRLPRKPRIEFSRAVYHVMSRGDHGESIFRDDQDRIRLLETLGEACEKTGWRCMPSC